jgi:dihydroorotase
LSIEELIPKLTSIPRAILGLEVSIIEEGAFADLTLFDPELKWKLNESDIVSKSKNTALTGKELTGKALAIMNNGQFVKCQ